MNEPVFRKKSLERISSPEQLNDYIRVSSPGLWMLLTAILLLLTGAVIWSVCGTIDIHTAEGTLQTVHPISFILN